MRVPAGFIMAVELAQRLCLQIFAEAHMNHERPLPEGAAQHLGARPPAAQSGIATGIVFRGAGHHFFNLAMWIRI